MRSSKSRSRSKQNRPRTLGNIINRVFDSSGPEGKVRGTPQQIIEKYQLLARDAQLSNDRVAAENFLQHAEHYTRLLAEAMREQAAEQEARQQQGGGQGGNGHHQRDRQDRGDYRGDQPVEGGYGAESFGVLGGDDEANLVDLPEARPHHGQPQSQPRREDRNRDDRPRDQRRDDRREDRRDDRPREDRREDRARDDRPRDERPRDERPREDRPREDRVRADRPREDRRRAPEGQAELPAFITGNPAPEASADLAAPSAPEAAKPARAPRSRKPLAAKSADAAPEAPEAAE